MGVRTLDFEFFFVFMGSANNQEFFFKIVIKIFWLKDIYIYSLETKTCITVEEAWKEHHIKFNQDKFEIRQHVFFCMML